VEYTRPAHRLVAAAGLAEELRNDAAIRAHVQFQLDNLMTYEIVAKGVAEGRVGIHGWLYDMEHGEIQAYDPKTGVWRGLLETADA
jgi:carbonic anhydrase